MRVLYVVSATQVTGGGSKSFLNLLHGIIEHGVVPMVVCPDRGTMYYMLKDEGIQVTTCHFRFNTYPPLDAQNDKLMFLPRLVGRMLLNVVGTWQLCNICRRWKPDIIHTNVSVNNIGYLASRVLRIPHVWHIREYGDKDFCLHYMPTKRWQKHLYCRPLSYTICITKDIQVYNELAKRKESRVIYNGIFPLNSFVYCPLKKPYLFYAGRLQFAKGVLELLAAYATYTKLCQSPMLLRIAGLEHDKDYVDACRQIVRDNALQDKVLFMGEIEDVELFYQEAMAVIVPSLSEGFGRVAAEAMFQGALVIGNNTAGTKEQFDNGRELTGEEIGLRYSTQEQLVQHLLNITFAMQNNTFIPTYEPMILRGQQTACELYSNEQYVEHVLDFYKDIISNNLNQKN